MAEAGGSGTADCSCLLLANLSRREAPSCSVFLLDISRTILISLYQQWEYLPSILWRAAYSCSCWLFWQQAHQQVVPSNTSENQAYNDIPSHRMQSKTQLRYCFFSSNFPRKDGASTVLQMARFRKISIRGRPEETYSDLCELPFRACVKHKVEFASESKLRCSALHGLKADSFTVSPTKMR